MVSAEVVVVHKNNAFDVRVTRVQTHLASFDGGCVTALAALTSTGVPALLATPDPRDMASTPARDWAHQRRLRFTNDLQQACEDAALAVSFP